jgi:hypothetical protein
LYSLPQNRVQFACAFVAKRVTESSVLVLADDGDLMAELHEYLEGNTAGAHQQQHQHLGRKLLPVSELL